jgi:hypothetical protein
MISGINRTEDNDFDEALDVNESAPNDLASLVNVGIGYARWYIRKPWSQNL